MRNRNVIHYVLASVAFLTLSLGRAPVTAKTALTGIGVALAPGETQGGAAVREYQGPIRAQQYMADMDGDGNMEKLKSGALGNIFKDGASETVSHMDGSIYKDFSPANNRRDAGDATRSIGTKILFDQGHGNTDFTTYFSSFADSLIGNGYTVAVSTSAVTLGTLQAYDLFVILPLGNYDQVPVYYYTPAELAALQAYVQQGGSLFMMCEYNGTTPGQHFNAAEGQLSAAFDITLDANMASDPSDYHLGNINWITFYQRNFAGHPIMQGIESLQSYAAATMSGSGVSLITTDPDANPANKSVGMALEYGNGKVVIVGDANYFTNGGEPEFINAADNRQFGLNIVSWLLADGGPTGKFVYLPLILRLYP